MDETSQLAREDKFLSFSSNKVIFKLDEPALMANMTWDEFAMLRSVARSQWSEIPLPYLYDALMA